MIREEDDYTPPEPKPRCIRDTPASAAPNAERRSPRWIPRLRIVVVFAIVGLVCIAIIHSDAIKGAVLVRIASTQASTDDSYSLLR